MMKAPSEKHLEDWIVANPEKFTIGESPCILATEILYRQLRLPCGIADIIASNMWGRISIIELKKGSIDSQCVTQILKYKFNLDHLWDKIWGELYFSPLYEHHNLPIANPEIAIDLVLVGDSVKDYNTFMACAGAGISLVQYIYDGNGYSFKSIDGEDVVKSDESWTVKPGSFPKIDAVMKKAFHGHASGEIAYRYSLQEKRN